MAWPWTGEKPLSEQMLVRFPTYICVTQPQWVNSFWCHKATWICVNIGSDNGLLPDGTKPLPEPIFTYKVTSGIHLTVITQEVLMNLICNLCWDITVFYQGLSGSINELLKCSVLWSQLGLLLCYHRLTSIPAWINNHMPSKCWDEITFPNFSGAVLKFGNG